MLRAVLVVGLILLLLMAAVFGPRLLQPQESEATDVPAAECDLDAVDCQWSGPSGDWQVSLRSLDDAGQGREYELEVVSSEAPDGLLAVLRGVSMYMGEYPVPLQQQRDGVYLARFTAPLCSTGSDMRWRLSLQQGQAKVGAAPFDMVFQGHTL